MGTDPTTAELIRRLESDNASLRHRLSEATRTLGLVEAAMKLLLREGGQEAGEAETAPARQDERPMLSEWRTSTGDGSVWWRDLISGDASTRPVVAWAHGGWSVLGLTRGSKGARGDGPGEIESARDAADAAALRWYRLPTAHEPTGTAGTAPVGLREAVSGASAMPGTEPGKAVTAVGPEREADRAASIPRAPGDLTERLAEALTAHVHHPLACSSLEGHVCGAHEALAGHRERVKP